VKRGTFSSEHTAQFLLQQPSAALAKALLRQLYEQQQINAEDILEVYEEVTQEKKIPLSLFSVLPPMEALCRYLRDQEHYSFKEISTLLSRDHKSAWAAYQRSCQRKKKIIISPSEQYFLPLSLFRNHSLTLSEHIVTFLHQRYHLNNKKIGTLLGKSPNTIAVLTKRAREKNASKKK